MPQNCGKNFRNDDSEGLPDCPDGILDNVRFKSAPQYLHPCYDLIRLVRRQDLPSHQIPAIALTAYARSEDRMRALRAGYQAHVAKPVEPAELVAMVASFVELSGSAH